MTYTTLTISREKLRSSEFESDSMIVSNPIQTKQISQNDFYAPAVELLALICSNSK